MHDIENDILIIQHDRIELENMWAISLTNTLAQEISVCEFAQFIQAVIVNRRKQAAKLKAHMLFYAWFDWQSAQFRFSIIPEIMPLPFKCEVIDSPSLEPIIKEFLTFEWHDGFESNSLDKKSTALSVYSCKI